MNSESEMQIYRPLCATLSRIVYISLVVAAAMLGTPPAAMAQTDHDKSAVYDGFGTCGLARIGMTLLVKNGRTITSGYYFYAKYLNDIAVTGTVTDKGLILRGSDGGVFSLAFIRSAPPGRTPANLDNDSGVVGTWARGTTVKRVAIGLQDEEGMDYGHRYEFVTGKSDAAFEAMVQGWYRAVLADEPAKAARYTDFPLRVNSTRKVTMIYSSAQLSKDWNKIFTSKYLALLKKDIPKDMATHEDLAMIGNGDAWFGEHGAASLNLPD